MRRVMSRMPTKHQSGNTRRGGSSPIEQASTSLPNETTEAFLAPYQRKHTSYHDYVVDRATYYVTSEVVPVGDLSATDVTHKLRMSISRASSGVQHGGVPQTLNQTLEFLTIVGLGDHVEKFVNLKLEDLIVLTNDDIRRLCPDVSTDQIDKYLAYAQTFDKRPRVATEKELIDALHFEKALRTRSIGQFLFGEAECGTPNLDWLYVAEQMQAHALLHFGITPTGENLALFRDAALRHRISVYVRNNVSSEGKLKVGDYVIDVPLLRLERAYDCKSMQPTSLFEQMKMARGQPLVVIAGSYT